MLREEFIEKLSEINQLTNHASSQKLGYKLLKKIFGTDKKITIYKNHLPNEVNFDMYRIKAMNNKYIMNYAHHVIKHQCKLIYITRAEMEFTTEFHDYSHVDYIND